MNYDIIKLLNLEQFNIKIESLDVVKKNNTIYCYVTLIPEAQTCPFCDSVETTIHSYYQKTIIHSISTNNPCIIVYKARRYKCKCCNHIFYENNPFSNKYDNWSTYTIHIVLEKLRSHTMTFTDVANELFLSTQTVVNIFDNYVDVRRQELPEIICFDEVYTSKKMDNKYAFVMVDFFLSQIIDIYSSRHKHKLGYYISNIPKIERDKVKYIIIDMWDSYRDLAEIYFPNAKIAVDSFHVIKHLNEAMTSVRLRIMRKYDKRTKSLQSNDIYYYMLKKFHYFFVKNYENIYSGLIEIRKMKMKWYKSDIRKYLLSIDKDLTYAYNLKEEYKEFNRTADYDTCDEEFDELIEKFLNSHLEEFREFGRLLFNWREQIKNSFIRIDKKRLSNGPIEGTNSRIKTMMKAANGFRSFKRFRNRVMYSLNKKVAIKYIIKK